MNYELPLDVQLFLRPVGKGKANERTMIVGVFNGALEIPERGEVVVGSIYMVPQARFDPGDCFRGLRADQILCSGVSPKHMKRLD